MEIQIDGIYVETIIGCYEHERNIPQKLVLNLKLYLDNLLHIDSSDDLENTVDYDGIVYFVKDIVVTTRYNLLEKLALEINNKILGKYSIVKSSTIEIIKPAICGVLARDIKVSHTTDRRYDVAIAIGSNTANLPKQQIITAIEMLAEYIDEIKISKLYKTKPFGYLAQNDFFNAVITGKTILKPHILLAKIKNIEKLLGKTEERINGPRVIDIDILYFDNLIYAKDFLILPHRYMHTRDFVLKPLADINPSWIHPTLNKDVKILLAELPKESLTIIGDEEYVTDIN